jgi:hypothetical protein
MRTANLFPLLLLLLTAAAGADVFKWTDADGRVRYGQHPPAGVQAERLKSAPAPAAPTQRKSPQQQLQDMQRQQETRQQQQAEAAAQQQRAANRKANCASARSNIEQLNYGGNRMMKMPDGSYQRLDENTRQAQLKKNREAVEKFCD